MKKKILVPIMALAIAVTVGFNYNMISTSVNETGMSLTSLMKMGFANAEFDPDQTELAEVTCTTTGDAWTDGCTCESWTLGCSMTGGPVSTVTYYPGTYTYCDCENDQICDSVSCH